MTKFEDDMNIVLSCYFTSKPDPQRGIFVRRDHWDYMDVWAKSLVRTNMHGVVLTDCSEKFIRKHQTSHLQFVQTRLMLPEQYSVNDERFFLFLKYLEASNADRVFISDISDVEFKQNILNLMSTPCVIYAGTNDAWNNKPIQFRRLRRLIGDDQAERMRNLPIYCPGCFGGSRLQVLNLVKRTIYSIQYGVRIGMYNTNLAAFNFAIEALNFSIETGNVYFSEFKKYQYDTSAAVRHK